MNLLPPPGWHAAKLGTRKELCSYGRVALPRPVLEAPLTRPNSTTLPPRAVCMVLNGAPEAQGRETTAASFVNHW
jgi:hypothetical protein